MVLYLCDHGIIPVDVDVVDYVTKSTVDRLMAFRVQLSRANETFSVSQNNELPSSHGRPSLSRQGRRRALHIRLQWGAGMGANVAQPQIVFLLFLSNQVEYSNSISSRMGW